MSPQPPRALSDMRVSSLREIPARVLVQRPGESEFSELLSNGGAYVRGAKLRLASNDTQLVAEYVDSPVKEVRKVGRMGHQIELTDGTIVHVERTGKCACGSPLKRFNAWQAAVPAPPPPKAPSPKMRPEPVGHHTQSGIENVQSMDGS